MVQILGMVYKILVIDENRFDTSISYLHDTCPPWLTHQKTDHQSNSSLSVMSKENTLNFTELIPLAYTSHTTRSLNNPGSLEMLSLEADPFRGASPRSDFWPFSRHTLCLIARNRVFLVKCLARLNYILCDSLFLVPQEGHFSIQSLWIQVSMPPRAWLNL